MRAPQRRQATKPTPIGGPVSVPGRLFGIRGWPLTIDDGGSLRLGPPERRWRTDGESTWAECLAPSGRYGVHPQGATAPVGDCTCGLYAVHPYAARNHPYWLSPNSEFWVCGVVEAWGRVLVHHEGFRAQFARPVILVVARHPRRSDLGRLIEDLAIAHRAALVELPDELDLVDLCHGRGIGMRAAAVQTVLERDRPGPARVDGLDKRGERPLAHPRRGREAEPLTEAQLELWRRTHPNGVVPQYGQTISQARDLAVAEFLYACGLEGLEPMPSAASVRQLIENQDAERRGEESALRVETPPGG